MAGLPGGGDDELGSGGTGTDHADPLAGDVEAGGPGVGVHEGAREAVAPGNVGDVGLREEPKRRHQVAARECLARARLHLPELALIVEHRARHFSVQLDVAAQVEAVDDVVEILLDVGLLQIASGPVPLLQQVLVEGVAVDETFGVGLSAGVAVEIPGAANAAALLERPDLEPKLIAQLVKHINAAKPGADNNRIEVSFCSSEIVHGVLPCGTGDGAALFIILWGWAWTGVAGYDRIGGSCTKRRCAKFLARIGCLPIVRQNSRGINAPEGPCSPQGGACPLRAKLECHLWTRWRIETG